MSKETVLHQKEIDNIYHEEKQKSYLHYKFRALFFSIFVSVGVLICLLYGSYTKALEENLFLPIMHVLTILVFAIMFLLWIRDSYKRTLEINIKKRIITEVFGYKIIQPITQSDEVFLEDSDGNAFLALLTKDDHGVTLRKIESSITKRRNYEK